MTRLSRYLVHWGLTRKPLRTAFLLLTIIGSMAAYLCTKAVMQNVAERSVMIWRNTPYDMTITGNAVHDLEESVATIKGVSKVEKTIMFDIVVGVTKIPVVLPQTGHSMLAIDYSEGVEPGHEGEIALPASVARAAGLSVGSEVLVATSHELEKPLSYTVSGILKQSRELAGVAVLTPAGAKRIHRTLDMHYTLLVMLHPSASQEGVRAAITSLSPAFNIKRYNYSFDQGFSIAQSLISVTEVLLLGAAAISLNLLVVLGHRERAYEIGVLRSLGFTTRRLVSALAIEGGVVVLAGGFLSIIILSLVAQLYEMGPWLNLLVSYMPSVLLLMGLCVVSVAATAWFFASRPITSLFRER